jgi:hypothetical protein
MNYHELSLLSVGDIVRDLKSGLYGEVKSIVHTECLTCSEVRACTIDGEILSISPDDLEVVSGKKILPRI